MITTTISIASSLLFSAAFAKKSAFKYHSKGENWDEEHPICGTGDKQSPINISQQDVTRVGIKDFDLNGQGYKNYVESLLMYKHNTVQVDVKDGTFWAVLPDGEKHWYKPVQFHFHSPSEHTIDGLHYDLEMHFVHADKNHPEQFAVLTFFFDCVFGGNQENNLLDQLSVNPEIFVEESGYTALQKTQGLDLTNFLNKIDFSKYYYYEGSLTTPPCSEGVNWFLVDQVQHLSEEQFQIFANRWGHNDEFADGNGNNRLVQPLGDRKLYLVENYENQRGFQSFQSDL